ncbi:extracellular serine/threonine protein kinase four-jointed-like [Ornithodoros turicata]|uniref:extracellular serine/threonine protein kinase four-jointed-like n=1 Tax=Ornithodoros turicata TaxID=34597 RepID=UPI003139382D
MRLRRTWLATAGLAFCLGMTVGVFLPLRELALKRTRVLRRAHNASEDSEVNRREGTPGSVTEEPMVNGIYWTERAERLVSPGFSDADLHLWRKKTRHASVRAVREGCGRMQNRLVMFDSGTWSCARYRQNNDQIQGELFSFYLAREMGMRNLPPAVLARAGGPGWHAVRPQLQLAQWRSDRPVVLTHFVDDLTAAYIPEVFRGPERRLHPQDVSNRSQDEIRDLVQWSDLIVFDYLTANLDRVVNNMFNQQWNPDMMKAPAHNLARQGTTGLLVFLDNESGLVHGYRLLEKYESYHLSLLDALCVFRKSTADALEKLTREKDIGSRLLRAFNTSEPGMDNYLPFLPGRSVTILNKRLALVNDRVTRCRDTYGALRSLG